MPNPTTESLIAYEMEGNTRAIEGVLQAIKEDIAKVEKMIVENAWRGYNASVLMREHLLREATELGGLIGMQQAYQSVLFLLKEQEVDALIEEARNRGVKVYCSRHKREVEFNEGSNLIERNYNWPEQREDFLKDMKALLVSNILAPAPTPTN